MMISRKAMGVLNSYAVAIHDAERLLLEDELIPPVSLQKHWKSSEKGTRSGVSQRHKLLLTVNH